MPTPSRLLRLALVAVMARGLCGNMPGAAFPPVDAPAPENGQVIRLNRTLSLLARSTPEHPQLLRLLYYGHPFRGSGWWNQLAAHLRETYPSAQIVAESHAIDIHQSTSLVLSAETEVYPFRPDLVVLATTGAPHDTRKLVRLIRERTSADILLITDPLRPWEKLDEPTDPKVIAPDPKNFKPTPELWYPWLNYGWVPTVGAEYETALADTRSGWKAYLKANSLKPEALVRHDLTLTPQGDFVMTELLKPWFEPPTWTVSQDPWDNPRVSTYSIPRDIDWKKGRLRLEFTGNRVEVVLAGELTAPVAVLLDGRPPGQLPGLRQHGRASTVPGTSWPALSRIGQGASPDDEEWTANVSGVTTNSGTVRFRFSIEGSKTGPDGEGTSDAEFLSRSHRVAIQPQDWNLGFLATTLKVQLPSQFTLRWKTELHGADALVPGATPAPGEHPVPLAYGLEHGRHVLELVADGGVPPALKAVRVYRPVRTTETKRTR